MTQPTWYDSAETGAPTLNNDAGSLLEVLRACLINGFNLKTVTSIVVASGVATATAATHGYSAAYGKLLRIEGAPVAGLNGDVQPLTVDTNTFTYACPGVGDGTYTGTITARRAPLDWVEAFTGTNKAIFARTSPEAGTQMLRVLDTAASPALTTDARVLMIESATGIDSFTNQAPSATQVTDSAGGFIVKGQNSVTAKRWALVGTHRGFYFFGPTESGTTEISQQGYFFGDGVRFFPEDVHFCMLFANGQNSGSGTSSSKIGFTNTIGANWANSAPLATVTARSRSGALVSESCDIQGAAMTRFGVVSAMTAGMPDKLFLMYPAHIVSNYTTKEVRGILPGMAAPVANMPFAGLGAFSVIGPTETDGRYYLAVQGRGGGSNSANWCIDLTGPWYD